MSSLAAAAVEVSNGFRAWGAAALLYSVPALWAFFRVAWRRAIANWQKETEGMRWGAGRVWAFIVGAARAGRETNLRVNAWIPVALLLFTGIAGGAIFISGGLFGGYATGWLSLVMLPMWALLAAAAWSAAIETAGNRFNMGLACGILLVTTQAVAFYFKGVA